MTFLPGATPMRAASSREPALGASPRTPVVFGEPSRADDEPGPAGRSVTASGSVGRHDEPEPIDRETTVAQAATGLTRSLGRRGLSIAEAASKLRTAGLTPEESAEVLDDFVARGWLDDALLAEQLVHSSMSRKDMGTRAIRQLLVRRRVAREVIEAAVASLPDDDAERALEFARTKARALVRFDDETATRRLMGMLARRGFGGSTAGNAARMALADERRGGVSGVRFR